MFFIVLIIVILMIIAVLKLNSEEQHKTKQTVIEVEFLNLPVDNENGTFETRIAGVNRYCSQSSVGVFQGIIFNESNNQYNKNAMVIASTEGNKIGYISEDDLSDYIKWSNKKPFTCVGIIDTFETAEGVKLYGKVTAVKPFNKEYAMMKQEALIDYYHNQ